MIITKIRSTEYKKKKYLNTQTFITIENALIIWGILITRDDKTGIKIFSRTNVELKQKLIRQIMAQMRRTLEMRYTI